MEKKKKKELDYTFTDTPKEIILSPEYLKFFYYDIMRDNQSNVQSAYDEDEKVIDFKKERGLTIQNVTIPEKVDDGCIYYTGNDVVSFFRHLRNAFAHFNITFDGEYLVLKDVDNKKHLTMNGRIKYEDLKEYCFLFFDQAKELEEKAYAERDAMLDDMVPCKEDKSKGKESEQEQKQD